MSLLGPFLALAAVSTVAAAFAPALLVTNPLLLIALSPMPRHLVLVAPDAPTLAFYAIAVGRLFLADPFMYLLGREFGDDAIAYFAEKAGRSGKWLLRFDGLFKKVSPLLLFLWPGPMFCALAGASGMSPLRFSLLCVAGTFNAVTFMRLFGESFSGPMMAMRAFLEQNTMSATVVTVLLSLSLLLLRRKSPARSLAIGQDDSGAEGG